MTKSRNSNNAKALSYVSSCCLYCKTCQEFIKGFCKGCKLGYDSGERDINRAKCKIKLCCFKDKKLETCADCKYALSCVLIKNRFTDYRLKKCLQLIDFIKNNGYEAYLEIANNWKNYSGKI